MGEGGFPSEAGLTSCRDELSEVPSTDTSRCRKPAETTSGSKGGEKLGPSALPARTNVDRRGPRCAVRPISSSSSVSSKKNAIVAPFPPLTRFSNYSPLTFSAFAALSGAMAGRHSPTPRLEPCPEFIFWALQKPTSTEECTTQGKASASRRRHQATAVRSRMQSIMPKAPPPRRQKERVPNLLSSPPERLSAARPILFLPPRAPPPPPPGRRPEVTVLPAWPGKLGGARRPAAQEICHCVGGPANELGSPPAREACLHGCGRQWATGPVDAALGHSHPRLPVPGSSLPSRVVAPSPGLLLSLLLPPPFSPLAVSSGLRPALPSLFDSI